LYVRWTKAEFAQMQKTVMPTSMCSHIYIKENKRTTDENKSY